MFCQRLGWPESKPAVKKILNNQNLRGPRMKQMFT